MFPKQHSREDSVKNTEVESLRRSRVNDSSGDTQRGCEYCAEFPDTRHWKRVEPEVSTEKRVSIYSLNSDAGSFECSHSGLRWSCGGQVALQYHFQSWTGFSAELKRRNCIEAGPLMKIEVILGELEEIHLPHFLCLGCGEASVRNAVKVLHWPDDSTVREEKFELTRHHARIVRPSLSPIGVVWKKSWFWRLGAYLKYRSSPKVHCEPLIFYTKTDRLKLHVYIVPNNPAHIEAIAYLEEDQGLQWIRKPGIEDPVRIKAKMSLKTECDSEIQPNRIPLTPFSVSNYFEVIIEQPGESFDVIVNRNRPSAALRTQTDEKCIWRVKIRRDDYQTYTGAAGGPQTMTEKHFIDQNFSKLINKVSNVDAILDRLWQEDVINWETYNKIRSQPTKEEKMRELLSSICGSTKGKDTLHKVLMEVEHNLMEEIVKGQ